VLPLTHGDAAMDAIYFRDKAETCLRLAKGLSWNNPARGELMELAEEFQRQAKELEAPTCADNGLRADRNSRRESERLVALSVQRRYEQFSCVFKRLERNPAPP
jgi:hypothetical protein